MSNIRELVNELRRRNQLYVGYKTSAWKGNSLEQFRHLNAWIDLPREGVRLVAERSRGGKTSAIWVLPLPPKVGEVLEVEFNPVNAPWGWEGEWNGYRVVPSSWWESWDADIRAANWKLKVRVVASKWDKIFVVAA